MSQNFAHNENIKTFDDVPHHLKLTVKHLEATKPKHSSYMAELGSYKAFRYKHKNNKIVVAIECVQHWVKTFQA